MVKSDRGWSTVESTSRVEAFSDGVFAIAITLLVLGIDVPRNLADGEVAAAIGENAAQFASAAISFAVIGIYWMSHHYTFGDIRAVDRGLLGVNLLHLATIVFLPFPTLLLSEYSGAPIAVLLYAGTVAAVGASAVALWVTAERRGLVRSDISADDRTRRTWGLAVNPIVFGFSMLLVPLSPTVAMYTWLGGMALNPIADRVLERRLARPGRPGS